jgi:hypothetical protein
MATTPQTPARAIGEQAPDDWRLMPEQPADKLPPEAGPLQRILKTPDIQAIATRYRAADAQALTAQARYRRTGRVVIWARFLALGTGGIALLPIDTLTALSLRPAFIVVQGAALIVSLLAALWLTQRGSFSRWMHARGAAEIARVELFDKVLAATAEVRSGEFEVLPLKLEYFRRYQLDVQRAFYGGRGGQHARAAGNTALWKFVSLAVVVVGAAAILYALGVFGDSGRWSDDTTQKVIIGFMTLISAVLALVSDTSLMDLNERNAARYATTHANLNEFKERFLEPVRAAAAQADEAAVLAFAKLVQDQISSEHREWVLIRDLTPRPEIELLLKLPLVGQQLAATENAKRG